MIEDLHKFHIRYLVIRKFGDGIHHILAMKHNGEKKKNNGDIVCKVIAE